MQLLRLLNAAVHEIMVAAGIPEVKVCCEENETSGPTKISGKGEVHVWARATPTFHGFCGISVRSRGNSRLPGDDVGGRGEKSGPPNWSHRHLPLAEGPKDARSAA